MSVPVFVPTNHSLHTRTRPVDVSKDRRFTPRWLVEKLHREHRFTVDACSEPLAPSSAIIGRWWGLQEDGSVIDGLEQSWAGEVIWANIPFSDCLSWVRKARMELAARVVMLCPANRTEQEWWQEEIERLRDRVGSELTSEFLPSRMGYGQPHDPENIMNTHPPDHPTKPGEKRSSPNFAAVLLRWRCGVRP